MVNVIMRQRCFFFVCFRCSGGEVLLVRQTSELLRAHALQSNCTGVGQLSSGAAWASNTCDSKLKTQRYICSIVQLQVTAVMAQADLHTFAGLQGHRRIRVGPVCPVETWRAGSIPIG